MPSVLLPTPGKPSRSDAGILRALDKADHKARLKEREGHEYRRREKKKKHRAYNMKQRDTVKEAALDAFRTTVLADAGVEQAVVGIAASAMEKQYPVNLKQVEKDNGGPLTEAQEKALQDTWKVCQCVWFMVIVCM